MPSSINAEAISAKQALEAAIERGDTLENVSQAYARYMLAAKNGNKVHASRQLGVDRRSMQRWAKRWNAPVVAPENIHVSATTAPPALESHA
jgi:DNA-binding NtrC family response regulator